MKQKTRFGGLQTPQGFVFELTGGDVSLDLTNTVDIRPTDAARDLIPGVDDLVYWAGQVALLAPDQQQRLREEAAREPAQAKKARREVIELRECLFQLFSSLADGREPPAEVLARWNRFVRRAMDRYEMVSGGSGLEWRLCSDQDGFDALLWPIVHSAMQLLTGPRSTKIRRCAGERCDWLFLDTSKRGNRRWCDMTVCGNRAKAKRHYERRKSAAK